MDMTIATEGCLLSRLTKIINKPFQVLKLTQRNWALGLIFAVGATTTFAQQNLNPDPTERWKTWQNAGDATVMTPQLRDGNVFRLTPAEIIYYAGVENKVNPVLLLVKLQHEQGLLASPSSDPISLQRRLDRAAGFGIFDSDPEHTKWTGFYPQLVAASYQFGALWRKSYATSAQAIKSYSSDPAAGQKVAAIYQNYAQRMNAIAGKRYSLTPGGWGHVDDFQDVGPVQIQKFLEEFPGNLKNTKLFGSPSVSDGAKVVNQPAIPAQLSKGARLTFAVKTDKPADQVRISFQNPSAEVTLAGAGTSWTFDKAIETPGSRPWTISVMTGGKVSDDRIRGTLEVVAGPAPIPAPGTGTSNRTVPVPVPAVPMIVGPVEAPATINVNEEMKLRVRTTTSANRVSIDFGPGLVFELTPDVARTTWMWEKALTQPGKREFVVRSYGAAQNTPSDQRNGVVLVVDQNSPSSVAHPLPNRQIARVLADPGYGYVFKSEHTGLDLMAPVGTEVKSMCDGVVAGNYTGKDVVNAFLIVKHSCGNQQVYGYYGHISSSLASGSKVVAGQVVGNVRQYGSNNHHLHFGINSSLLSRGWGRAPLGTTRQAMLAAGWLDPLEFLKGKPGFSDTKVDPYLIPANERVSREQFGISLLDAVPAVGQRYQGSPEQRLRSAGLIQSEYRGADPIIRSDAVRMTYRFLNGQVNLPQKLAGKPQDRFNLDGDLDDDAELRNQSNALAALGIFSGVQNGTIYELEPARQLSRAEQATLVDRSRAVLGNATTPAPVAGPKAVNVSNIPAAIEQNSRLVFNVMTDKPASKVTIVFQNPDAEAPLNGNGVNFSFDRDINTAGTRPWRIRVYDSNNQLSDEHLSGSLVVKPAAVAGPVLQPWQQAALNFVSPYLDGRQKWTECWDAGSGRKGTFCYRFARQAVGLAPMGSAIDAFEALLDQGRASTSGFESAPVGSLIFYRIGTYGHVAVKVSATEVAGHGNELAFTSSCPPITKMANSSLAARAPYAGFYAPGSGAVTLDPNVIAAPQRVTRQDFVALLKAQIRDPKLSASFANPLTEPLRAITRGEAALFLGRALVSLPPQLPAATHAPLSFNDAGGGEMAQMLGELSSRDIVKGQSNELAGGLNFFPLRQLSRSEAEIMIARAASDLNSKLSQAATPPVVPAQITGVQPQGAVTLNTPAMFVFQGQNLTPEVRVTVSNCDNPQSQLVGNNQIQHRCTPRVAGPQPAGWKANTNDAMRNVGTINVAAPVVPAQITGVQPQGAVTLNTPAMFVFQGQNLTPEVRVTVSNCDNPQSQLVGNNQIQHRCTPRVAGPQPAGWKADANDAMRNVGTINVAAPVLPAQITGVQQQGTVTLNSPAMFVFQGQNLTPEVRVTVSNCDNPQSQLVGNNQIQHRCTPRVAGPQPAGWKVNANDSLRNVGNVNVAAPQTMPPRISNATVNPAGKPIISFDVQPNAARATASVKGRTFQFNCSTGTRVVCQTTGAWPPSLKGNFVAVVQAFDAAGKASTETSVPFVR
ncbi:MAG: M23 family metallopeptidase [Rhodoferax sp.]|nr:MAG: M23 family metallopeptidase [Rhodoferax sp.]